MRGLAVQQHLHGQSRPPGLTVQGWIVKMGPAWELLVRLDDQGVLTVASRTWDENSWGPPMWGQKVDV